MSFLEFDYPIVRACLNHERYAWNDFVDRFMDLTLHVVDHTAQRRGKKLDEQEKIELCEAIFRAFRYNDYQLLREFSFQSAVSTYLTVIARRVACALMAEE